LCLDVRIEGWNWELELDLVNTAVWMSVEFGIGIGKPIPWNWDTTKVTLPQYPALPLRIGMNHVRRRVTKTGRIF
jgi:hypothetical protein